MQNNAYPSIAGDCGYAKPLASIKKMIPQGLKDYCMEKNLEKVYIKQKEMAKIRLSDPDTWKW